MQTVLSDVRTVEDAMRAYDRFFVDNGYLEKVQGWVSGVVENFREPDPQLGFLFARVTMGQLLTLPMLVSCTQQKSRLERLGVRDKKTISLIFFDIS